MAQFTVNVNGRNYRLSCDDGEEQRLQELGAVVKGIVGRLNDEYGRAGDDRLLVMALLMQADELLEAHDRIAALEKLLPTKKLAKLAELASTRKSSAAADGDELLQELEADLPVDDGDTNEPIAKEA